MSLRTERTLDSGTIQEDMANVRLRIIENETHLIENLAKTDASHVVDDFDTNEEIDEIDFMIQQCQEKIRYYSTTKDLNDDTVECLEEAAAGIDATDDELEAELTAVKIRLNNAKKTLNFVLQNYYPEYSEEMRNILMQVESASSAEEEEARYIELNDDMDIVPVLILQRSLCILQHPTKPKFFKLAPLS